MQGRRASPLDTRKAKALHFKRKIRLKIPPFSLKSKGGKIKSADLRKVILKMQLFNITF